MTTDAVAVAHLHCHDRSISDLMQALGAPWVDKAFRSQNCARPVLDGYQPLNAQIRFSITATVLTTMLSLNRFSHPVLIDMDFTMSLQRTSESLSFDSRSHVLPCSNAANTWIWCAHPLWFWDETDVNQDNDALCVFAVILKPPLMDFACRSRESLRSWGRTSTRSHTRSHGVAAYF
jgi:hypothetical protein